MLLNIQNISAYNDSIKQIYNEQINLSDVYCSKIINKQKLKL